MDEVIRGDGEELEANDGSERRVGQVDDEEEYGLVPEAFEGMEAEAGGSVEIGVGMMDGMPDPERAVIVHGVVGEPEGRVEQEQEGEEGEGAGPGLCQTEGGYAEHEGREEGDDSPESDMESPAGDLRLGGGESRLPHFKSGNREEDEDREWADPTLPIHRRDVTKLFLL